MMNFSSGWKPATELLRVGTAPGTIRSSVLIFGSFSGRSHLVAPQGYERGTQSNPQNKHRRTPSLARQSKDARRGPPSDRRRVALLYSTRTHPSSMHEYTWRGRLNENEINLICRGSSQHLYFLRIGTFLYPWKIDRESDRASRDEIAAW